jgi:endonuclease/exonuclease/phosphatase family metal-dependent hydrolase
VSGESLLCEIKALCWPKKMKSNWSWCTVYFIWSIATQERRERKKVNVKKVLLLLMLATVVFAALAGAGQGVHPSRLPIVTVASYNAYIGTDVFAVLCGAKTLDQAVADIVAVNFPQRAKAIVKALAKPTPDLISIQEAWHIEIQSAQLKLDWNYKEILAALLKRYGYREVVSSDLSDIIIPLDPATPAYYVRVTDHDVIFAKKQLKATEVESLLYDSTFKAQLGGQVIESKRGLVSAVFRINGHEYRFVNTHLETEALPAVSAAGETLGIAQELQAQELVDHLADESRPVILAGDFNAPFDSSTVMTMESAGFADMWPLRIFDRHDPGFTCCQAPDLLNGQSILDQRIDHIFVRNDNGNLAYNVAFPLVIEVIGDRPADKTKTYPRLWPSDHAGLRSTLIIPALYGSE